MAPADDAVLDQPVAGLRDLLLLLFGLGELTRVADGDGACEAVGQLDLVQLSFDGTAQVEIVDVAQDEQPLDDLSEGLARPVERMLPGTGIEPPGDVRGDVVLELDARDKPQQIVPVLADQAPLPACVTRLDRLGRLPKELLKIVEGLKERGIHLASLKEDIETSSAAGEPVFQVYGAITRFELRLIAERTRDGIAAARKRCRKPGRPPLLGARSSR